MIVYISIGNSDDKLSQHRWSNYCAQVRDHVIIGKIHGEWYSRADSEFQNACWCVEFTSAGHAEVAKMNLVSLRKDYGQDSAAWAVAETEFV